jgi:hypothetical protein
MGPCPDNRIPPTITCPIGQRNCKGLCLDQNVCCPNPSTGCCSLIEKACDGSCIDATQCCIKDDRSYSFVCNVECSIEPSMRTYSVAVLHGTMLRFLCFHRSCVWGVVALASWTSAVTQIPKPFLYRSVLLGPQFVNSYCGPMCLVPWTFCIR